MPFRRELLHRILVAAVGAALPAAVRAVSTGGLGGLEGASGTAAGDAASGGSAPTNRDTIAAAIRHWDALGIHRSGTDVDTATAGWLRDAALQLGLDARLETFTLRRRTPVAAVATLMDGTRFGGVPLFDAGETPVGGIEARIGTDAAEIPVLQVPPYESLPGARALLALRDTGRHPAILAVTDDAAVLPGLALQNAEHFHAPFGPPVLQLPSEALATLRAAAGSPVRVEVRFRTERVPAHNVRVDLPGRDPALEPLVIITPRSSWWHSTSERGGGIALWLDLLRMLTERPPLRPVIFSANTGHELGHIGMQRFLDADESLVARAHAWIHLGANFAASLHPRVRLQASDADLMDLAERAMTRHRAPPMVRTEPGTLPFGEARDIHAGGGRYVSLLGSQGAFHHPDDRWPHAVDLQRTVDLALAFREIVAALAYR